MKYVIKFSGNLHTLGNVVMVKFKMFQRKELLNITALAGNQVVHSNEVKPLFYKAVT